MAFNQVSNPFGSTAATLLVNDYAMKMMLGKMGFQFDPKDLSQFEAAYLMECHKHFNECENNKRQMEAAKMKKRRG
jgi:hypothetical protein